MKMRRTPPIVATTMSPYARSEDEHLPLIALHHELHGLSPALDDLVGLRRRVSMQRHVG